mmetsp:Transcript_16596/g.32391  ORF Transcript_16596/g.32391 Transcript_16596/m.32391 type:complete len:332 (-) Transcript_16596:1029-2024(-)
MLLEKALDGLPGGFDIFCEPFCPFIELSSRVLVPGLLLLLFPVFIPFLLSLFLVFLVTASTADGAAAAAASAATAAAPAPTATSAALFVTICFRCLRSFLRGFFLFFFLALFPSLLLLFSPFFPLSLLRLIPFCSSLSVSDLSICLHFVLIVKKNLSYFQYLLKPFLSFIENLFCFCPSCFTVNHQSLGLFREQGFEPVFSLFDQFLNPLLFFVFEVANEIRETPHLFPLIHFLIFREVCDQRLNIFPPAVKSHLLQACKVLNELLSQRGSFFALFGFKSFDVFSQPFFSVPPVGLLPSVVFSQNIFHFSITQAWHNFGLLGTHRNETLLL